MMIRRRRSVSYTHLDQVVNRIDNRDGVTKEQVRRMAQMWEGLVKLEDYSSLEPMSKEYWEVMSKVVEELKKLSQREQLIMTTELMDDKIMLSLIHICKGD